MAANVSIFPHRVAAKEDVDWGDWILVEPGPRQALPRRLAGWDYAESIHLSCDTSIDCRALVKSTHLKIGTALRLNVIVDCGATNSRHHVWCDFEHSGSVMKLTSTCVIPPGSVASSITVSRVLTLAADTDTVEDRVASREGERIAWSEPVTLRLEGDGERFPVEAVPFGEIGRGDEAWALDVSCLSLEDSFMGSVRLMVNEEHPVCGHILSGESEVGQVATAFLRYEVIRRLLLTLAQEFGESESVDGEFEDDTVGAVLGRIARSSLRMTPSEVLRMGINHPAELDDVLMRRLGLLRGVKPL